MILLDTNVVSELLRSEIDPRVDSWLSVQDSTKFVISVITEAELYYGVEILPVGRRRDRLTALIKDILQYEFAGRILPFDSSAARSFALIGASRKAAGLPISHSDCMIAAVAHSQEVIVATRNIKDFEGCGIKLINPWQTN